MKLHQFPLSCLGDEILWQTNLHHAFTWCKEFINTQPYTLYDLNLQEKSDVGKIGTALYNSMTFRVAGNWTIAAKQTGSDCFGLL
jgi:hypothetical protein